MKYGYKILIFLALCFSTGHSWSQESAHLRFDFYGDAVELPTGDASFVDFQAPLSLSSIQAFYEQMEQSSWQPVLQALANFRERHKPDDWMFYQLIRKTAQQLSPKAENYHRYTLYKWYFLLKSGYDATLAIAGDRILFYVHSDENIYNIPFRLRNGKQYVCLNYHDYGSNIDFEQNRFSEVQVFSKGALRPFSYRLTRLPKFHPDDYAEKELRFQYQKNDYHFRVKINPQVKSIFANYPVVDYEACFNMPLSAETYSSLIPSLRKNVSRMKVKDGVDFLMRFTRYAFLFKPDIEVFGQEKRLSPEQTLLYENSDCEDRAALFFYLVREIYDLPMLVLAYPQHVTIAVGFEEPVGNPILYKGRKYSVCEPTPQKKDLSLGQLPPSLKGTSYEVAYVYTPNNSSQ